MMLNEMNVPMELKRIDVCDLMLACTICSLNTGAEKWDLLHEKLVGILDKFDAENQACMFRLDDGYYVEIETTAQTYNFWLCREGCQTKYEMFRHSTKDFKRAEGALRYWKKWLEDADFMKVFLEGFADAEPKEASAVYTGGNIWLFYGKTADDKYFLADDNGCVLVLDESPEDFDESLYEDWQNAHKVEELSGARRRAFCRGLCDRLLKEDENHRGGITDTEIEAYRKWFMIEI